MAYSNYGGGGGGGGGGGYNQNQYGNAGYGGGGYSTTTYGAQGGDTGGGFMGGSQGGSQGAAKGYGDSTLRPLTILQIQTAAQPYPEADFKVDDTDLSQLVFVGQIRNISKQATNITYKLDDGTGTIEVKVWIDSDAQTHDDDGNPLDARGGKAGLAEGMWAKVYGRMKSFGNRRHVAAFKIRPVGDMNEINAHLLEAAYVHLYFTRGPPEQLNGGGAGAGAQGNAVAGGMDMDQGGGGGHVDLARQIPNLGASAKKVMNTLYNTPQNNEGLHVQVIAQQSGLSVQEVLKGADELTNHSLIFTTVDDNTWALMEA